MATRIKSREELEAEVEELQAENEELQETVEEQQQCANQDRRTIDTAYPDGQKSRPGSIINLEKQLARG